MFCEGVCMYLWCAALRDAVVRFGRPGCCMMLLELPIFTKPWSKRVALSTVHHLDNAAAPIRSWWPREAVLLCSSSWGISGMQLYKCSRMWSMWVALSDKHTVIHYTICIMWRVVVDAARVFEKVWIATLLQTPAAFSRKVDAFEAKKGCLSHLSSPDHTYPCASHCSLDGYRKAAA